MALTVLVLQTVETESDREYIGSIKCLIPSTFSVKEYDKRVYLPCKDNPEPKLHISQGLVSKGYKYQGSHPIENVPIDLTSGITIRSRLRSLNAIKAFLSVIEPKKVNEELLDADWIIAMQEELNQFEKGKVWHLVPPLKHRIVIGTKWVYRNKVDEHGTVTRNKARLVVQV
ncbi:hypothetical protein FXO38_10905 [Capsicum annuum]|nr:hypothetical protein FXO38_10905 [Capsicum annuum]